MEPTRSSKELCFSEELTTRIPDLPTKPADFLIKYSDPVLYAIRNPAGRYVPQEQKEWERAPISFAARELQFGQKQCETLNTSVDSDSLYNTQELKQLVENMYPPIEWKEGKRVYMKTVSLEKGTTDDLLNLYSGTSCIFEASPAEITNISEKNEKILIEAFDECIRQILVEKPLIGILLRQVRDHIIKSLKIQEGICASSTAYAVRKQLQLIREIEKLRETQEQNHHLKTKLERELEFIKAEMHTAESRFNHHAESEVHVFQHEYQNLLSEKRRLFQKLKHMVNVE